MTKDWWTPWGPISVVRLALVRPDQFLHNFVFSLDVVFWDLFSRAFSVPVCLSSKIKISENQSDCAQLLWQGRTKTKVLVLPICYGGALVPLLTYLLTSLIVHDLVNIDWISNRMVLSLHQSSSNCAISFDNSIYYWYTRKIIRKL